MNLSAFLQQTFETTAREQTYSSELEELLCLDFVAISRDFDLTCIQDSWSWRNTHIARELACILINDRGKLNLHQILHAIELLEANHHSLGPNRYHDGAIFSHLLYALRLFVDDQDFTDALKSINCPDNHPGAINLIRATLALPESKRVTDADAKRAALSAFLTSLRQNVGSCFATAPAIMIQQEQPLQFLADIAQMFGTGKLIRVIGGVEYIVPISVNWGVGDLIRPIYLASLGRDPLKTLAFSPGLQAAFEATGLMETKLTRDQKRKAAEALIKESGDWLLSRGPFTYFTADDVLKNVFLHYHGLTEQEVDTYREQPLEGVVGEIVIQAPHMREGKAHVYQRYASDFEKAKNTFKALTDNPILKSWEFTLASLSEAKADFAKWNLYSSLGVQPNEPYGIGQSLNQHLQELLDRLNEEIEESQSRYDHLFAQAKYLEGRLRRASTSNELEWLRTDYRMRQQEINRVLAQRDELHEKGRKLANLFPFMITFYGEKIREYFQEVYDAQMHDVSANLYDDSPAGFRLLYKHGRGNTALWTMINSAGEYIQYLNAFFVATENELRHLPEVEGIEKELSELVTVIVSTIKRPEFLESSFYRLARTYNEPIINNPLENLTRVKRKPWAYISGGTMATLVSCYYNNASPPNQEKRWVESEKELLAFLIETIRGLPSSVQKLYQAEPNRSMLSFSPTHAFLCKPGWKAFKKAWESDLYPYTWIRDMWENPQLNFLDDHILDSRMMDYLVAELLQHIPHGYRPLVKNIFKSFPYAMRANEFRDHVINALSYEKWFPNKRSLDLIAEELDSILYRCLPLFPEHAFQNRLRVLVETIEEIDEQLEKTLLKAIDQLEVGRYKMFSAKDLKQVFKALLISGLNSTRSSIPFHEKITEAMQVHRFAYPAPILFADTNWVKNTFGFTVNPGTGQMDLWRFDATGSEGRPISVWRRYLNGTERKDWGLYNTPSQYGQFTK